MIVAMHYTRRLFPVFTSDEAYLTRAAEAATGDVAPVVGKSLRERVDQVSRMLRTRSLTKA
jgi:aminopeptidase N